MSSYWDVIQEDGGIFSGEKKTSLVNRILKIFEEENLSYWQARNVCEAVEMEIAHNSVIRVKD